MHPNPLIQQLKTAHHRAVAVLARAREAAPYSLRDWVVAEPTRAEVLEQTWHELTSTLAELLTVHDEFEAQRPRYQDLLEFAPDGYLVTDNLGLIQEANEAAAQLFAVPQEGLVGKRLADLVAPDEVPYFEQGLLQLSATRVTKHRETRLRSRHRAPFDAALVVAPASDFQGRVVGLRWLLWDIAERKRQGQALLVAREAAEQSARLQAVIAELAEALSPHQALAAMIHQGASALGTAAVAINVLSADGTRLTIVGVVGYPEPMLERYREFPVSAAMPGADVLRSGEPLWIGSHQEFSARYPHLAEARASAGYEADAVFPLLVDRRPLGTLAVSFAERRDFTPEDQAFLLALARLLAQVLVRNRVLYLENSALRQEVADRAQVQAQSDRDIKQLHNYTADVDLAREEERRRLALELHDQLGGALTALKMDVFLLRTALGNPERDVSTRLGAMSESIDGTITLVRDMAAQLRPAVLDELGLPAALEWAAVEFERRFGIECQWVTNADQLKLDPAKGTAIFRVVQECLTNIVRHAQATLVTVTLLAQPDGLVVQVGDNGQGFVYSKTTQLRSVGLAGMHERLRAIGGELKVDTAPGCGTRVWIRAPLADSLP